ncbi:MAG: paraquat-inducible protein A [Phycisphaerae bacterium]|nr:paraquat-inducible protein A [Phycisphaerae bacterium]
MDRASPDALGLARQRVLALVVASLALYVPAVTLPVMTLSRLGHETSTSILGGIDALWQDGHWALAVVVGVCSVIVPLGKLVALLVLSSRRSGPPPRSLLAVLELTGRWGMLDVLLVAALVAAVKLGELVQIEPAPAILAFAGCVAASIVATGFAAPLVHDGGDEPPTSRGSTSDGAPA